MISCNYKTTKLFGGVCVCVCLVYFYTHVFLYGNFSIFSSILNQQTKLVEGSLFLGLDAIKLLSSFSIRLIISH